MCCALSRRFLSLAFAGIAAGAKPNQRFFVCQQPGRNFFRPIGPPAEHGRACRVICMHAFARPHACTSVHAHDETPFFKWFCISTEKHVAHRRAARHTCRKPEREPNAAFAGCVLRANKCSRSCGAQADLRELAQQLSVSRQATSPRRTSSTAATKDRIAGPMVPRCAAGPIELHIAPRLPKKSRRIPPAAGTSSGTSTQWSSSSCSA